MAFKSAFERSLAAQLATHKVTYTYEETAVPYVLNGTYWPDFKIVSSGVLIEAKGLLDRESKRKMAAVKEQHPELDIRFVFMDANKRIPGTKQTHGQWATKNGFTWRSGRYRKNG
jgi:hypothetical protein